MFLAIDFSSLKHGMTIDSVRILSGLIISWNCFRF